MISKVSYSQSAMSSLSLKEDLALGLAPLSQNPIITRNFCKNNLIDMSYKTITIQYDTK